MPPVLGLRFAISDSGSSMLNVLGSLRLVWRSGILIVPDLTMPPSGSTYLMGNDVAFLGMDFGIS